MHLNIVEFPVEKLVWIVSGLLESIIEMNDNLAKNTTLTRFHARAKPIISIYAYLLRILKFTPFTNESLLSMLVYFDRIAVKHDYALNSFNAHRLLITSIVVACKFTSDVIYPMGRYSKVGGLPLLELNQLELEFLFLCEFRLHVSLEDLQDYGNQLLHHAMNNITHPPLDQPDTLMTPIPTTKSVATKSTTTAVMRKKRKLCSPELSPVARKRLSRYRHDNTSNTNHLSHQTLPMD